MKLNAQIASETVGVQSMCVCKSGCLRAIFRILFQIPRLPPPQFLLDSAVHAYGTR